MFHCSRCGATFKKLDALISHADKEHIQPDLRQEKLPIKTIWIDDEYIDRPILRGGL